MEHSVYRIIDANFNRAREAIRLIEEFCRFALNCDPLTGRAKQLRHELSAAVGKLDAGRLIASRDTLGDVGVGKTVEKQLGRADLKDCFTAGCKRLTEALRTIAEMTQMLNPSAARTIEDLRYAAYTLEKDIIIFSDTTEKFKQVKLYVIITSQKSEDVIYLTNQCVAGGADCIQLRAKDIEDNAFYVLADEFVKICRAAGILSVINDRVDIATITGADGVHLGQDDLPVEQARKLQLTPLIIGKSTHSREQLCTACSRYPAYVSLGPVFPTDTKPTAKPVGLNYVTEAIEILKTTGICHVAIGGITLQNVEEVLGAGAASIAVCSAVTKASNPAAACREFKKKISDFDKK